MTYKGPIVKHTTEKPPVKNYLETPDGRKLELAPLQIDAICTYRLIKEDDLPLELAQSMFKYAFDGKIYRGLIQSIPPDFFTNIRAFYLQQDERCISILSYYRLTFYCLQMLELIELLSKTNLLDPLERQILNDIPTSCRRYYQADLLYAQPCIRFESENLPFFVVKELAFKIKEFNGEDFLKFSNYNLKRRLDYYVISKIKPKLVELVQAWASEKISSTELSSEASAYLKECLTLNKIQLLQNQAKENEHA